jgi:hypothetical protein
MLVIMGVILVTEPVLRWLILPTLLIGTLVPVLLRRSQSAFLDDKAKGVAGIRIDRIPVSGGIMGAVLALGTIAPFLMALPEARWFLLLALPLGTFTGLLLHVWHIRHPRH